MAHKSLKELYEERASSREFKERNSEYEQMELVYRSKHQKGQQGDPTYRPNLVDGSPGQEFEKEAAEIVVNQVRRVVNHFTAMFAYPPRTIILPLFDRQQARQNMLDAGDLTALVDHFHNRSNLASLHPRNTHWLSLRGDCVYGLDWGCLDWGDLHHPTGIHTFSFDPAFCYPRLSHFDLGGVEDMLVCLRISPESAQQMYKLRIAQVDQMRDLCRVFYYWTKDEFRLAVEEYELENYRKEHKLGFCPFRWVHGDPSGKFAQADVREVPKLQETFNEGLLLAIDAIRKQVDASWWYSGAPGKDDLEPQPGHVIGLPEGAQVGRFEIAADPQIILGVMQYLEQSIQATTGVSPLSMGAQTASPSAQRSGSVIRHQVEAAEARAETRKAMLQSTYARLAEMMLYILRTQFEGQEIRFRANDELRKATPEQITEEVEAVAEYGGFLGLPPHERVQVAMQGLGHLWDEEYAVGGVLDLPGVTPQAMKERLHQFRLDEARTQAEAQGIMQQAQQAQQPSNQPAQEAQQATMARPQRPTPPTGKALRAYLAKHTGSTNGHRS